MAAKHDDQLVKIARALDQIEAGIWQDLLEQEGIPVYLKIVDPLGPAGVPSVITAVVDLLVLARDEKRARWLLGRIEQKRPLET